MAAWDCTLISRRTSPESALFPYPRMHGQTDLWHGDRQRRADYDRERDDGCAESARRGLILALPFSGSTSVRTGRPRRNAGRRAPSPKRAAPWIANVHPKLVFGTLVASDPTRKRFERDLSAIGGSGQ